MKKQNGTRLRRMARNCRGASILLALFLMLVCTAVGVVILSAGVAAGGRKSRIADMDRRFFSVDSAASVFRDLIEEQSVTVVRKKITTETSKYDVTHDKDTNTTQKNQTSHEKTDEYKVYLDGTELTTGKEDNGYFLETVVKDLWGRTLKPSEELHNQTELPNIPLDTETNTYTVTHSYTLSHTTSASGVDAGLLAVDVDLQLDEYGNMTITLTSKDDDTAKADAYSLRLYFSLSISSDTPRTVAPPPVESGTSTGENKSTMTVTRTTTETKTDTFAWVFESMDVIRK